MIRKNLARLTVGLALVFAIAGAAGLAASAKAEAAPSPLRIVAADQADHCANKAGTFFGLKPWYYYMGNELGTPRHGDTGADRCSVECFNIFMQNSPNACGETKSDLPGIALVVIDDLLRVAGLVAIFFVILGAFQYVASRGNAERAASAQSTIIAALTGLAISLVAVAFISFLGSRLS
jgi:hypothetical protein